jgi:hypothetical protein
MSVQCSNGGDRDGQRPIGALIATPLIPLAAMLMVTNRRPERQTSALVFATPE